MQASIPSTVRSTTDQLSTKPGDLIKLISKGSVTSDTNPLQLIELARKGISFANLSQLMNTLDWDLESTANALGVTKRTLERYRHSDKALSLPLSEKSIEVAKIAELAVEYFGSVADFNHWLDSPNLQFNQLPPRDFLHSSQGLELVKRIILGLKYGFTA